VRIELAGTEEKIRLGTLFTGQLNRRGTTEAQFRFPANLVGSYKLRYVVDTAIGSTEFTQEVRLEDKVSILLTTEKPIYQPGQTIHVRGLALDRSDHEAAAKHKLTFELEDSRGNKVFQKSYRDRTSSAFASAEFGLADEVNLGTYHLRALMFGSGMGDAEAPYEYGGDRAQCRTLRAAEIQGGGGEFSENGQEAEARLPTGRSRHWDSGDPTIFLASRWTTPRSASRLPLWMSRCLK